MKYIILIAITMTNILNGMMPESKSVFGIEVETEKIARYQEAANKAETYIKERLQVPEDVLAQLDPRLKEQIVYYNYMYTQLQKESLKK